MDEIKKYDLFIFAGEVSADLHGANLLKALYKTAPHLKVFGVGGPEMRKAGMECILPMEAFQVMGFVDVFLALPKLMRQFYQVRRAILTSDPRVVILIDYPGFNLRMAAHLRKKGFKNRICHYICPSVWAWGKKRIPQMAKTLDLLISILPFEAKYFSDTQLKVAYVGHPLAKAIHEESVQKLSEPPGTRLIAIFPGSRKKEILRNLPLHLRTAKQLAQTFPDLRFALSLSHPRFAPLIKSILIKEASEIADKISIVPSEKRYALMQTALCAIAKSGTVTLELALHEVPTVVTYGVSTLDLILVGYILRIRLPYYCLVNIIGDKEIFPELIGPHFTQKTLYTQVSQFLQSPPLRNACRQACASLKKTLLSANDPSATAANHIINLLN